jgi:ABC-type hemin transport system ATPase subunit
MPACNLPLSSRELLGEEEMHTILLQSVEVELCSQLLAAAAMESAVVVVVVVHMNYGEVAEDFVDGILMVDNAIVVDEGEVEVIADDDSLAQVAVVELIVGVHSLT